MTIMKHAPSRSRVTMQNYADGARTETGKGNPPLDAVIDKLPRKIHGGIQKM